MELLVDFKTFKELANRLGADTGDRATIYWTKKAGFMGDIISMAMLQGIVVWKCEVPISEVGELELTDLLKTAIKVLSIR